LVLTHPKGTFRVFTISGKGLRAAFVLITALTVSASAQAATIEFGSVSWAGADNLATHTFADVTATAGPVDGATLSWTEGLELVVAHVSQRTVVLEDELPDQVALISFTDSSVLGDQSSRPTDPGNGNCNDNGNGQHAGNGDCKENGNGNGRDDGQPIPEPTAMVLLGAGLLIGASRLRRRK
jgi:hypothetical protein